jgi:NitT/TauT family transport system substrate-binding protein
MSRPLRGAVGLLLVAAVGLFGYFYFFAGKSNNTTSVTIAQTADFFLYAPIYIARDAGFFRQQGLDARIVSTGGDEKSWAAVLSGSAQFGVGDPTFVAISAQRGQPGRVIASIVNGVPFWGVTLRQDVPVIDSPNKLNGFSVATFPSPSTAYTLQAEMFRRAGLEPNIRQGAFGALLPMLKARQADIALELEPNVSTAVKLDKGRVVYSLAALYGDFAITGMTTTPTYLQENSQTVQKIVCALRHSLSFIKEKPEATLELLNKRFPELGKDVASEALKRVTADGIIPKQVAIDPAAWKKAADLRVQAGDLTNLGPFRSYVDNSAAEIADRDCATN